jgi:hypothetical protein
MQQVSVLETNIGSSTTGNSANTQIIFNDAGTLRGDSGLTYNKTTDLLSVGAATITGDLTVDTNTLFVDAANNRVGMGTLTPVARLIVRDGANRNLLVASDASHLGSAGIAIGSFTDNAADWAPLSLVAKTSIAFGLNGSTAMTLNSTGLGVGMTPASSQSRVQIYQALGTTINGALHITDNATTSFLFNNTSSGVSSIWTSGILTFSTGSNAYSTNGARMTLDASGNLLVGVTSPLASGTTIQNLGSARQVLTLKGDDSTSYTLGVWSATTTGDNLFSYFGTETSLSVRGSIDYNRAGGLVRYNTTSDYRAKDIIGPVSNSGSLIDSLKVYVGKMKGATIERPMLIAHEAQSVAPYAVTGTKDEVDADGNPKYQQMDVSSLVPLLIAEIQSLRARVQTLEAR